MNLDNPEWTLLFEYSEWLDQQGVMVAVSEDDNRSHEDFVNGFLAERQADD